MIKEIIRIPYAETTLPESWIFAGGDPQKKVPIIFSVFLIRTESKRILVDAGCETMPEFEMSNFRSPMAALKEHGYAVSDITDVIITHAHHDHMECVKYFENAVIHIQEDECRAGKKYLSQKQQVRTFSDQLLVDDGVSVIKIGGHSIGSCVVECTMADKTYVLCGDECYSLWNLKNRVPTAKSFSPEKSREFIDRYVAKDYICLLCHEAE